MTDDVIPFIGAKLGSFLTDVGTWMRDKAFPALVDFGKNMASNMWSGLVNWFRNAGGDVKDALRSAIASLLPSFNLKSIFGSGGAGSSGKGAVATPRSSSPAARPRSTDRPSSTQDTSVAPAPKPAPVMTKTAPIDTPYMQKWFGAYGDWPGIPDDCYGKQHPGMDVTGKTNDVFAPESGTISKKWDIGMAVRTGMRTHVLHHLVNMQVGQGQQVRVGQYLGDYAKVGNSSGAHLHWEIHNNPWDPFAWNNEWNSNSLIWAHRNRAAYDQYRHTGGPIEPNRRYIVKNDESIVLTGKTGAGYVEPHAKGGATGNTISLPLAGGGNLQMVVIHAIVEREHAQYLQRIANPPARPVDAIRALQSRWD